MTNTQTDHATCDICSSAMQPQIVARAVPNIRFEFEPDRIVGQMDYSYSAEYYHDLDPEYG